MTRLVVTVEARFVRTPDGATWTCGPPDRGFWDRYLTVFSGVRVVARVTEAQRRPPSATRVDGDRVEVWPVPYYVGSYQYLLRSRAVSRAVVASVGERDAVLLRVPSLLGTLLASRLSRVGHPYALEVIGDPHGVLAPGVVRHPLRPLLRQWFTSRLRQQCRSAYGVAYITERYLQESYPPGADSLTTTYSSVDLPAGAFRAEPRSGKVEGEVPTLISIGSLEQMYKGIDTLIEAVALLTDSGMPVRLVHVGDGRFRPHLLDLATRLGVAGQITFRGLLPPGEPILAALDAADLFVMPSRTEGQGRAMIEAMARGLPAIGSTAGGIPELLPPEYLVPPDNPAGLAASIRQLVTNPDRMAQASARNLNRAHDFSASLLAERRTAFYQAIRMATEDRAPTSVRRRVRR
ncbi:glycosyltransferase family 4 protein [Micromonospora coxensis]|uniref:Glycosyltransferase involved in cell wall bisynthesis n=1 Tax=Micromonospora coxensis TaxID=356852 RepID=A0A1C5JQI7_9ACTN|nr:glycosyltransferase family 4 protein [Micromonospora coxensis]SCG72855.1 Glycosyltransferase involved in cell wall bisynthesis [Micromonospora coxensis]